MADRHGDWIWYELLTGDAAASTAFYGDLLGWTVKPSSSPEMDYREIQAGDGAFVGGMMQLTPEMSAGGAQPCWLGYISVDDVDARVAAIEAAGGKTMLPAQNLEGVGRFAMMADPQGAMFYVMKTTMDEPSTAFNHEAALPGHCSWNELATSDPAAAKAFYTAQFGWTPDGEMDMGPMGKYEFLRFGWQDADVLGAVMPMMEGMPMPFWTFYFRVPSIDAAATRIAASGGKVLHGPAEIPGGEWIVNGQDPQGAYFALVGPKH